MLWLGVCIFGYAAISVLSSMMFGSIEKEILMIYLVVGLIGVVLMIVGALRGKKGNNTQNRTVFECNNIDVINFKESAERVLRNDGYFYLTRASGEIIWMKKWANTPMQKCISIEYVDGSAKISGWMIDVNGAEYDLSGFAGILPKSQVKKTIKKIIENGQ